MTKAELIAAMADGAGLTKEQAKNALDAFTNSVTASLKSGNDVRLVGFGTFAAVTRKAGMARNPRTGEAKIVSPEGSDWEDPSWAPDGRHIMASRRDGRSFSLWVLDTEGDTPVKLSLPNGDWRSPDWSASIR